MFNPKGTAPRTPWHPVGDQHGVNRGTGDLEREAPNYVAFAVSVSIAMWLTID